MLSQDTITRQVRAIVAEIGALDPVTVTGTARLADDLGFGSLQLIELAATIEQRFPVSQVEETTILDIITVRDVELMVARLTGAGR